ncbi:MAG: response regulator [Gammaproteobacteria bacterium]|nr:response regulator [Gammaproteobacteria bacterium]
MTPDTANKPLILVADDDPTHQLVIQAVLKKAGYRVLAAPDGKVALEQFAQASPDIVLMDCQMPILDGYQATQAIRQLESSSNDQPVVIIAVTGNTAVGDRERCIAAGADDYLGKPFTGEQLREVVSKYLQHSEPLPAGEDQDCESQEPNLPVVESRVLDGLSALQEAWGQDVVQKVVQVYLDSSKEIVAELRLSLDAPDAASVTANAQALKSSSAKIGALKLADLCKALETAGRQGDLSSAAQIHQHIQQEHNQVLETLKLRIEPSVE